MREISFAINIFFIFLAYYFVTRNLDLFVYLDRTNNFWCTDNFKRTFFK